MNAPPAKPYLYADELAALTPWSVEAVRKKVQRGVLRRGVHFFQDGPRGRLIFKWAAIVALIEHGEVASESVGATVTSRGAEVVAIEEATERLRRLLD